MTTEILNYIKNLSIKNGFKFEDKSFKYDTIYYSVKSFSQYIKEKNTIDIGKNGKSEIIANFIKFFQLNNSKRSANANKNYFSESLNFLKSTNVLEEIDKQTFLIKNKKIFHYIGSSMENAYIFQYLCAYTVFKNDNLWAEYVNFCNTDDFEQKKRIYDNKIIKNIQEYLKTYGKKGNGKWAYPVSKFFMMILGLVNEQNEVARTSNLKNKKITPEILANKAGTRTKTTKHNEYSKNFEFQKVQSVLKDYLSTNYHNNKNSERLETYTVNDLSPEILKIWKDIQKTDEVDNDSGSKINKNFKKHLKKLKNLSLHEKTKVIKTVNFINLKSQHEINSVRKRDQFIALIAKLNANYLDELTLLPSFEGKDGNNYVEAHHILEFRNEKGPDILLNLICLRPEHHAMIHHGSKKTVTSFFKKCRKNGVITLERFEKMCTEYHCLTNDHVQILHNKSIITTAESKHLLDLINKFGSENAPIT